MIREGCCVGMGDEAVVLSLLLVESELVKSKRKLQAQMDAALAARARS